jgi:hypothetical protein
MEVGVGLISLLYLIKKIAKKEKKANNKLFSGDYWVRTVVGWTPVNICCCTM